MFGGYTIPASYIHHGRGDKDQGTNCSAYMINFLSATGKFIGLDDSRNLFENVRRVEETSCVVSSSSVLDQPKPQILTPEYIFSLAAGRNDTHDLDPDVDHRCSCDGFLVHLLPRAALASLAREYTAHQ